MLIGDLAGSIKRIRIRRPPLLSQRLDGVAMNIVDHEHEYSSPTVAAPDRRVRFG
jgi:hypothetical protein